MKRTYNVTLFPEVIECMIDHTIHKLISFSIYRSSFNEDKQVTVIKFDNQLEVCQVQSDLRMFSRFGTEFPRNSNILIP